MKQHSFFVQGLVVLLLMILSYAFFGFYYEGPEGIIANLFAGNYSDLPFTDFFYIAMIGYGELFKQLYIQWPLEPWYDILSYFFLWIAFSVYAYLINLKLKRAQVAIGFRVVVLVVLYVVIMLPNIIVLNLTRISILVSGSGLFFLYHLIQSKDLIRVQRIVMYLCGLLLFVSGILFRLEGGVASLVVLVIGGLCFLKNKKRYILALSGPAIILFGILGYFSIIGAQSQEFVHQVEPDIEYQISGRGNLVPISQMSNAADSAKYAMAEQWIVNDPEYISIAFLRSIIKEEIHFSDNLNIAASSFITHLVDFLPLNIFFLGLVSLTFFLAFHVNRKHIVAIVIFNLSVACTLFLLAFFIKMEPRIWVPLVFLATIMNLYKCIDLWNMKSSVIRSNVVVGYLLATLLLFFVQFSQALKKTNDYRDHLSYRQKAIDRINSIKDVDFILLDLSMINDTYLRPFDAKGLNPEAEVIVHNLGALSLSKQYKFFLDSRCECNSSNYQEFYDFIYAQKAKAIILSTAEGIALTQNYLKEVYHLSYKFRKSNAAWPDEIYFYPYEIYVE